MNMERFLVAQERDYEIALSEIRNGRKKVIGCGTFSHKFRD